MASNLDGGALTGWLSGMRMSQEDADRQKELQYARARRAVTDVQQDAQYGENMRGLGLRNAVGEQELQRLPTEYKQRDEQYAQQARGLGLRNEAEAAELARLPTRYRQDDEKHALGLDAARGNIASNRQGMQLNALRIDEAQAAQRATQAQRSLFAAFGASRLSGDFTALRDTFNQTIGADMGIQVDSIQRGEGGKIIATSKKGEPMVFGSQEELAQALETMSSPEGYLRGLYASRQSRTQAPPAALQETTAIFDRLQPLEGESEDERWMRAYTMQERGAAQNGAPQRGLGGAPPAARAAAASAPAAAPAPVAAASPPEGARVRGPDGRTYVVKNGRPVPID